jgi:hypothetical protein
MRLLLLACLLTACADEKYGEEFAFKAFDAVRISSHSEDEHFQSATVDVDLGDGPYASATLSVQLRSTCYPFAQWQADPPPSGENWPASCDAFDRNFEFTLDPPQAEGAAPGFELVRSITPFGGPLDYEVDFTDVANFLHGKHRLQVVIPTWSDGAGQVSGSHGGWNVSATLHFTPGVAPRKVLAVLPLWNGNLTDAKGPGSISFHVPPGTTSYRLEYRATGHGGETDASCMGPAEEFCERTHSFVVDGEVVANKVLWRDNCGELCTKTPGSIFGGEYCLENPCGYIPSVQAPRANWCPGSVTPPYLVKAPSLAHPGPHTFDWHVSALTPGIIRTSVTYFAFGS